MMGRRWHEAVITYYNYVYFSIHINSQRAESITDLNLFSDRILLLKILPIIIDFLQRKQNVIFNKIIILNKRNLSLTCLNFQNILELNDFTGLNWYGKWPAKGLSH